jgi:hypothetical protein
MCIFIFSTTLSEIFPTLRRPEQDTIINKHKSSYKVIVTHVKFETFKVGIKFLRAKLPAEIFYSGFYFLKVSLHNVFISRSALKA